MLQIVAPFLEITNLLGCVTGLRMALEISRAATNTGQSSSATSAKTKRALGSKRRNDPQSVIDNKSGEQFEEDRHDYNNGSGSGEAGRPLVKRPDIGCPNTSESE